MQPGHPGSASLFKALLAAQRSRTSWNDRLEHWERPASTTEDAQITRSAVMVQNALNDNSWLARERVLVRPQGSYRNNTNVRQDSDMDLSAWHPGIKVIVEDGLSLDEVARRLGYTSTSGRIISDIAANLRDVVGQALRVAFGAGNVQPGNKAFHISAVPGSRSNADVVPAIRLHYVKRASGVLSTFDCVEGVIIYARDGTQILNFPHQHHENAKAKRERTRHRFKKVVRSAKRIRDELVTLGYLPPGHTPSFLIESLVYGVEDSVFSVDEDRYDRMRRIFRSIGKQVSNPLWTGRATEINEVKLLFYNSQPWSAADAQAFVTAALRRLET